MYQLMDEGAALAMVLMAGRYRKKVLILTPWGVQIDTLR
jgi:hypothetical protein